jgi:hypothetical protein
MERKPGELYWDEDQKCLVMQGCTCTVNQVTITKIMCTEVRK